MKKNLGVQFNPMEWHPRPLLAPRWGGGRVCGQGRPAVYERRKPKESLQWLGRYAVSLGKEEKPSAA